MTCSSQDAQTHSLTQRLQPHLVKRDAERDLSLGAIDGADNMHRFNFPALQQVLHLLLLGLPLKQRHLLFQVDSDSDEDI